MRRAGLGRPKGPRIQAGLVLTKAGRARYEASRSRSTLEAGLRAYGTLAGNIATAGTYADVWARLKRAGRSMSDNYLDRGDRARAGSADPGPHEAVMAGRERDSGPPRTDGRGRR